MTDPAWLRWSRELQAIAQNGLTYSENHFDRERYQQILAVAADIAKSHAPSPSPQVDSAFWRDAGPATPKVDVRGAVFQQGRLLLVRERSDGCWTLPGGWADVGESASEAVVREVREESGFETRATKLVAVLDRSRHEHPPHPNYIYKLFFLCQLLGGGRQESHEIMEVDFFDPERLPPLSSTRITPAQVALLVKHAQEPQLPTQFD
jgi:ADP-ribose pyrophosphatase YjhB (NUDIX family)